MNDTSPAAPWADYPRKREPRPPGAPIPPLSDSERARASEPHGITCQQCGETYPWETYAAHLEEAHARGVTALTRPPAPSPASSGRAAVRALWRLVNVVYVRARGRG